MFTLYKQNYRDVNHSRWSTNTNINACHRVPTVQVLHINTSELHCARLCIKILQFSIFLFCFRFAIKIYEPAIWYFFSF